MQAKIIKKKLSREKKIIPHVNYTKVIEIY